MLPPRIPKKPKRESRWRSPAHANFVRSHQCIVPGCDRRPIEFMHIRLGAHCGIAQKPDDWRGVSGCQHHHSEAHTIGEASFQRKYGVHFETLISAFIKASPKRREIESAMREREQ